MRGKIEERFLLRLLKNINAGSGQLHREGYYSGVAVHKPLITKKNAHSVVHIQYRPECLTPTVRGSGSSVILWGAFCWHDLDPVVPLEKKVTANQWRVVLSDHYGETFLCRGLFQDDNASIHTARRVTEWFDKYGNDVNYMLWPLQAPHLNKVDTYGRFWTDELDGTLDRDHQTPNGGIEEWCSISPVEFQRL